MTEHSDNQNPAPSAATFWAWASTHYARPGVADSLISIQDSAHLNVNIMLWVCWAATAYDDIPRAVMQEAISSIGEWNRNVTTPLRSARREAKHFEKRSGFEKAAGLRDHIKSAELDAERIEIEILEKLAHAKLSPPPVGPAKPRARRSLLQYAALAETPARKDFSPELLHRVIDNIFDAPWPSPRDGEERDQS